MTDALFSASSLLLAVALARASTVQEFGEFALAMVMYLFAIGLIRSAVTDTILSSVRTRQNLRRGFERASVGGFVGAALFATAGLLMPSHYFLIVGLSLPGLVALDYIRVTYTSMYRSGTAMLLGLGWGICVGGVSIAAILTPLSPTFVFAMWGCSGALIGAIAWAATRMPLWPRWQKNLSETRAAAWFSLDYVAGSGGSLLSTSLVGALVGAPVIAALRGAGTLLGPVNLVSTTARSLVLPYLTNARKGGGDNERRSAIVVTVGLVLAVMPLAAVVVFLPSNIGVEVLGATWLIAQPIILPLAIESLAALGGSIAAAGHRSQFAGARAVVLRLSVGGLRPFVVVVAGTNFGAGGAAWSMAILSIVNLGLWWGSYIQLTKRDQ